MGQCCSKKIPDVEIEVDGNVCCDHLKSDCCAGLSCCIIKIYRAASTKTLTTQTKQTINAVSAANPLCMDETK